MRDHAPTPLLSMTASSAEDIPRGMEFLYSPNRLNVAISRAQALALVFAAPRLRAAKCDTVEQMRMVNALCAIPPRRGMTPNITPAPRRSGAGPRARAPAAGAVP